MRQSYQRSSKVLAAVAAMALSSQAFAANLSFAPGDLVLFFQERTGTETVYVNLGNAGTLYTRGQTGVNGQSVFNIVNIGSALESAFGPGWASNTEVYAGLAGVWGTSATNGSLQDGDPHRTIYIDQPRNGVGTLGTADSGAPVVNTNTAMTTGSSAVLAMNNVFDDPSGANGYNGSVIVATKSASGIDEANPFVVVGPTVIQDTAFQIFAGGVQQQGGAGEFGDFAWVPDTEFALDLYRIQARDNVTGQTGFGEGVRTGTYEGTFVVTGAGDVSFLTAQIPEPSSAMLALAGGLSTLAFRRRR